MCVWKVSKGEVEREIEKGSEREREIYIVERKKSLEKDVSAGFY